jgi:Ca2+-binding RTX toxin-like protein
VINGGGGSDHLYGGLGKDTLNGGTGRDVLDGGLGADLLTGGTGADDFVFGLGSGTDHITDFNPGEDHIVTPLRDQVGGFVGGLGVAKLDELVDRLLAPKFKDLDTNGDHHADAVSINAIGMGTVILDNWTVETLTQQGYLDGQHHVVGDWLL